MEQQERTLKPNHSSDGGEAAIPSLRLQTCCRTLQRRWQGIDLCEQEL